MARIVPSRDFAQTLSFAVGRDTIYPYFSFDIRSSPTIVICLMGDIPNIEVYRVTGYPRCPGDWEILDKPDGWW
jgi:hypothetical protein